MRAYDAIEFRHALWHYFTQTGGERGAADKKKIAIQLKKSLSFFHSHFLLSSFFPFEIFLINTSLIFYNSLLIFLHWKLFRRIFSYFLWFFFLTGRLNAGQILFHRCHKFSPSTNPQDAIQNFKKGDSVNHCQEKGHHLPFCWISGKITLSYRW